MPKSVPKPTPGQKTLSAFYSKKLKPANNNDLAAAPTKNVGVTVSTNPLVSEILLPVNKR
jgi:hypothetical protein